MDIKKMKLQGERLKEARALLGLSQVQFCDWLSCLGIKGNYGEPYKPPTVAAWENARRKIPDNVKQAICENLAINGHNVQYAYMNGDSKYMTQAHSEYLAVNHEKANELSERLGLGNIDKMSKIKQEILIDSAAEPSDDFSKILLREILPLYGLHKGEIFDKERFCEHVRDELREIIYDYLDSEEDGL